MEKIEIDLSFSGLNTHKLAKMVKSGEIPRNVTHLNLSNAVLDEDGAWETDMRGRDNNEISDLSPLRTLEDLRVLNLMGSYDNRDLSPLRGLKNLTHLYLSGENASKGSIWSCDLSALADLINLEVLVLKRMGIRDITPLTRLRNLKVLDLYGNMIDDITPLAELKGLEVLNLNTSISDISPVAGLANLKKLSVYGGYDVDISPLTRLTNLEWLNVSARDYSPLDEMTGLRSLGLILYGDDCPRLPSFCNMKDLTDLWINSDIYDKVIDLDISFLRHLTKLKGLWILNCQISDISAIAGLTDLKKLDLEKNKICNLAPLAGLTNLEDLNLWNNPIDDISPLSSLTNLYSLGLYPFELKDVTPLLGMTKLKYLSVDEKLLNEEQKNALRKLLGEES